MDFSKTVVFENIADFDFTPQMGAMYGGIAYPVMSGERKVWPYELADHMAGALAKQMFLKKDRSATVYDPNDKTGGTGAVLWNDTMIAEVKAKILGEVVLGEKPRVLTEAEMVKQKTEEMNKSEPEITVGYRDKGEVIADLQKHGIKFDARRSKAELEKMLV